MPASATPSSRFRKAAVAERDRLLRQREKVNAEVVRQQERLRDAEDRLHRIDEQLGALREIVGDAVGGPALVVSPPNGNSSNSILRASAIRETAVRLLLDSGGGRNPIHYRRWLEMLEQAGHSISGKRPDAVFLNQIVRSPVIRATTEPGVYEIDWEAPERLREQLAQLEDAARRAAIDGSIDAAELENLAAEVRRVQKAHKEATAALKMSDAVSNRAAA